jgi:hypothetical protein
MMIKFGKKGKPILRNAIVGLSMAIAIKEAPTILLISNLVSALMLVRRLCFFKYKKISPKTIAKNTK